MTDDKVREGHLRRVVDRRGLALTKSRRRDPKALGFGRWMLVDAETGHAVFGESKRGNHDATLEEIEAYLMREE